MSEPTDKEMLDWMIDKEARVSLDIGANQQYMVLFYLPSLSWTDLHPTGRQAIAAAINGENLNEH